MIRNGPYECSTQFLACHWFAATAKLALFLQEFLPWDKLKDVHVMETNKSQHCHNRVMSCPYIHEILHYYLNEMNNPIIGFVSNMSPYAYRSTLR